MTILSVSASFCLSTFTFVYNIQFVIGNFFIIPFTNPKQYLAYFLSFRSYLQHCYLCFFSICFRFLKTSFFYLSLFINFSLYRSLSLFPSVLNSHFPVLFFILSYFPSFLYTFQELVTIFSNLNSKWDSLNRTAFIFRDSISV